MDEDFLSVTRMRTGEELASDLRFLSRYGLTKKLTLQRRNADEYVLTDLIKAVTDITIDANICFPSYNPDPLDLAPDELNQDVRTDFHNLPFRFIVPGYSNAHQGQRYLRVDHSFSFQELRFSVFQKKCERVRAPDDHSTGLLFLCMFWVFSHLVESAKYVQQAQKVDLSLDRWSPSPPINISALQTASWAI